MLNILCEQAFFSRQSERFNDSGNIFLEVEKTLGSKSPAE